MAQPRTEAEWTEQIRKDVATHPVMIYAKGEKHAAVCGFSHRVMELFDQLGVDYEVRDVFADPLIRPALTTVTQWPTTPQVFIGGRFVGGHDRLTEMAESGELQRLLAELRPQ
jgi:monothiol glutaredoxin